MRVFDGFVAMLGRFRRTRPDERQPEQHIPDVQCDEQRADHHHGPEHIRCGTGQDQCRKAELNDAGNREAGAKKRRLGQVLRSEKQVGDSGSDQSRADAELADYLLIAERVLGLPAEAIANFERMGLAESALASPQAGFGGVEAYTEFETKAAVLCWHLVKNHPLPDGNKRCAFLATVEFVERNGRAIRTRPTRSFAPRRVGR